MQYITTSREKWKNLKVLARENRKDMTFSEKIVWNMIRKKQFGCKFRRQQAIADFIVDFVCLENKLVIEIDGHSHDDKKAYDDYRTSILNSLGYKVLRIKNDDVAKNGNLVEKSIQEEIKLLTDEF